jgi:hypothetical protein
MIWTSGNDVTKVNNALNLILTDFKDYLSLHLPPMRNEEEEVKKR